jgi:hypothetical protein
MTVQTGHNAPIATGGVAGGIGCGERFGRTAQSGAGRTVTSTGVRAEAFSCDMAGAPESGGSGAPAPSTFDEKAGAAMGAIINSNDLEVCDSYVQVRLTTDEVRATIEALRHAIDYDTPLRTHLECALTELTFVYQQDASARIRRELAEELLDLARLAESLVDQARRAS